MHEHRHQPLLPHRRFVDRVTRRALGARALLLVTLAFGMAAYHW